MGGYETAIYISEALRQGHAIIQETSEITSEVRRKGKALPWGNKQHIVVPVKAELEFWKTTKAAEE